MADWIAVTHLLFPSWFKKNALLFDKFTFPEVETLINFYFEGSEEYHAELTWLYENGIIVDLSNEAGFNEDSVRSIFSTEVFERMDKEALPGELREFVDEMKSAYPENISQILTSAKKELDLLSGLLNYVDSNNLRMFFEVVFTIAMDDLPNMARLMAAALRDKQKLNAYPLLVEGLFRIFQKETVEKGSEKTYSEDVLSVVLKRLPEPDDSVPWEQIIDYRSDTDSEGKILALRNWVHEMARSELTQQEIEDKLDWLIYDYERHLKLHKMKYNTGTLETLVVTGAQFLEDMAKFNWGDAAKALFELKHRRISLLEAEISSPGAEIAYLVETRETFR